MADIQNQAAAFCLVHDLTGRWYNESRICPDVCAQTGLTEWDLEKVFLEGRRKKRVFVKDREARRLDPDLNPVRRGACGIGDQCSFLNVYAWIHGWTLIE